MKLLGIIRDFFRLPERVRWLEKELIELKAQVHMVAVRENLLTVQTDNNHQDIEMLKWKLKNTEFDVQYLNTIHNTKGRTNEY